MIGSGAQNPPGQAARSACSDDGTFAAGTQCAPLHAGAQAGNDVGSTTGGPVHGHISTTGGFAGASHDSVHAPVGAVGSEAVGLKQGAHFSPAAHTSSGSCAASLPTGGRQVDRQRPSAPAIDVHDVGTNCPPDVINGSGTQKPPVQVCRSACSPAGTFAAGTQCAPLQAPSHAGNVDGSTTGGPVQGQLSTVGGSAG